MIKSERSITEIQGDLPDVLADLTCILKSLIMLLEEEGFTKDEVKEEFQHCIYLAFLSDEELKAEIEAKLKQVLDKLFNSHTKGKEEE